MNPTPIEKPSARCSRREFVCRTAVVLVVGLAALGAGQSALPSAGHIAEVRKYIKSGWSTLSRSNRDLPAAAIDPKLPREPGARWPVYVSRREDRERVAREVRQVLGEKEFSTIELKTLPADLPTIQEHGLLYLPRPYVVPGGRFNEMYGWDSYFIQVGLLQDGEVGPARDMVDNFVYEIEHYGTILNANRTYYLTRSQPPFLTRMILGVYRKTPDRAWLKSTLPAVEAYYRFWTIGPHAVPETGLSRYWDSGEGPAPEVISDERDDRGRTHYDRVREYYRTQKVTDYDLAQYYDRERDALTPLFYFDYNFQTKRRRAYEFATTFYPLWVGIARKDQAARVRANLSRFEAPGGILTSTQVTGSQWDAPFGWAPLQMIAVEGLRRYGYDEDADRVATKFLAPGHQRVPGTRHDRREV
jgi:alpha,alpha-trehalase